MSKPLYIPGFLEEFFDLNGEADRTAADYVDAEPEAFEEGDDEPTRAGCEGWQNDLDVDLYIEDSRLID